jgi:hypothetical protein
VIRSVNIDREPTTFGSKSPDILIKNIEVAGVEDRYSEGVRATSELQIRITGESCVSSNGRT